MKKSVIIIVDRDVPVKHLLNTDKFEVYEATGNENVFTMVTKENEIQDTGN